MQNNFCLSVSHFVYWMRIILKYWYVLLVNYSMPLGARSEDFFWKNFYSQFTQLVIIVADVVKKPRLWKNPLRTRGTPYPLAAVSSNATSSQFYPSASEWLDPWPARRAPRPAPIMMKSNFASTTTVQKRCLSAFCYYTRPFQFRLREHHACTEWPHLFPKRQYLHNMQVIKSQWKGEKITLLSINLHFMVLFV